MVGSGDRWWLVVVGSGGRWSQVVDSGDMWCQVVAGRLVVATGGDRW